MYKKVGLKLTYLLLAIFLGSTLLFASFEKEVEEKQNLKIVESQKNRDEIENNEQNYEGKGVFVGDESYDFSLLDREGNEIKLSDLKGKVIFINFWTTWGSFCKKEMPHIQEIYDQYKDKEIVILAINVLPAEEVGQEGVNEFLEKQKYTFPVLYDIDGKVSTRYKVSELPTTYIIDKNGMVADFISGGMEKKTMVEKIENVLNK
ncbi:TlpA disulfide reductase family protein [Marinisporobacter balticus]|uniref:Peroxiredoxin n=1 Tax=Marinisporobacter balticus TaxID=2018667 RepID=A0A4R2L7H7_9FIRM|nr:TlpA disulfide reductase family protein [Marinisporobacter balticus]TCO78628.1 peroxiredoxin [Marinisporobacter balticus]